MPPKKKPKPSHQPGYIYDDPVNRDNYHDLDKYSSGNNSLDPPWSIEKEEIGKYFREDYGDGIILFRRIVGYSREGAKLEDGRFVFSSTGDPYKNSEAMYMIEPLFSHRLKKEHESLSMYNEVNLRNYELPGTAGLQAVRVWQSDIDTMFDCSSVSLSKSINCKGYVYDINNVAQLYQVNQLYKCTAIQHFDDIVTMHNLKCIDLRYISHIGAFQFIKANEWSLIEKTFPIYTAFETIIEDNYSEDMLSVPLRELQCDLTTDKLMGISNNTLFVMINLHSYSPGSNHGITTKIGKFHKLIQDNFPNSKGIKSLLGAPRTILLGLVEASDNDLPIDGCQTTRSFSNVIGFTVITLPEHVNKHGILNIDFKTILKYQHQPMLVSWLISIKKRKGVATFLLQAAGTLCRYKGQPWPFTMLNVDETNDIGKLTYETLGFTYANEQELKSLLINPDEGNQIMIRRGTVFYTGNNNSNNTISDPNMQQQRAPPPPKSTKRQPDRKQSSRSCSTTTKATRASKKSKSSRSSKQQQRVTVPLLGSSDKDDGKKKPAAKPPPSRHPPNCSAGTASSGRNTRNSAAATSSSTTGGIAATASAYSMSTVEQMTATANNGGNGYTSSRQAATSSQRMPSPPTIPNAVSGDSMNSEGSVNDDTSFRVLKIGPGQSKYIPFGVDYPVTFVVSSGSVQYQDCQTTAIVLSEDDGITTKPGCVWQMTNVGTDNTKIFCFSARYQYKMGLAKGREQSLSRT